MTILQLFFIFALLYLASGAAVTDGCNCKNNGQCTALNRCLCPADFIGQHCEVPAKLISDKPSYAGAFNEYSYFYFQPNEVNFYKLNFTICMMSNPSRSDTLFFIQTERNNGSLRSIPSLFETAKLVLGADGCVNFTTHYISIKRREDDTYRRIIIGLKPMQKNDTNHYLNVYRSSTLPSLTLDETVSKEAQLIDGLTRFQEIKITMSYELYLQNNYYSSIIVLLASSTLIIIFMVFISYIRKRYAQAESEDTLTLQDFRVQVNTNNPERQYRMRKNNLTIVEIFMPATIYGQCSKYFHSQCLGSIRQDPSEYPQHDTCAICLVDFAKDDEIRMTPCRHRYHRDCIDDWCQNNLSCPICRQALDFSKQIRQIYYHYLRGDLYHSRGLRF